MIRANLSNHHYNTKIATQNVYYCRVMGTYRVYPELWKIAWLSLLGLGLVVSLGLTQVKSASAAPNPTAPGIIPLDTLPTVVAPHLTPSQFSPRSPSAHPPKG